MNTEIDLFECNSLIEGVLTLTPVLFEKDKAPIFLNDEAVTQHNLVTYRGRDAACRRLTGIEVPDQNFINFMGVGTIQQAPSMADTSLINAVAYKKISTRSFVPAIPGRVILETVFDAAQFTQSYLIYEAGLFFSLQSAPDVMALSQDSMNPLIFSRFSISGSGVAVGAVSGGQLSRGLALSWVLSC